MTGCLPRIVFPVVLFPLIACPLLCVPPVSPVDTRAEHRGQQHYRHGESDETRERESWALEAVGPGGLAVLVAP